MGSVATTPGHTRTNDPDSSEDRSFAGSQLILTRLILLHFSPMTVSSRSAYNSGMSLSANHTEAAVSSPAKKDDDTSIDLAACSLKADQFLIAEARTPKRPAVPGLSDEQVATLERYGLTDLAPLRTGSMASIFRCLDRNTEMVDASGKKISRPCALKIPRTDGPDADAVLCRFHDEIAFAAYCDHPHVLRTLQIGQFKENSPFFTMPLAKHSLADLLPQIDVNPKLAWKTLRDLTPLFATLDYLALEVGLVHGDLKPANLLFDFNDSLLVADLGLARTIDYDLRTGTSLPALPGWGEAHPGLSQFRGLAGTLAYMSPEVVLDKPVYGAADQYAAGMLLFRVATGRHLHEGSKILEIVDWHRSGSDFVLTGSNPRLPSPLANVINRMIRSDPAKRYPTCTEAGVEFTAALDLLQ